MDVLFKVMDSTDSTIVVTKRWRRQWRARIFQLKIHMKNLRSVDMGR